MFLVKKSLALCMFGVQEVYLPHKVVLDTVSYYMRATVVILCVCVCVFVKPNIVPSD